MPDEFEGTHDDEESKVSAQDEVCEDPPYEPPDEDYPSFEGIEETEDKASVIKKESTIVSGQGELEDVDMHDTSQEEFKDRGAEYDEYSDSDVEIVLDSNEEPAQAPQGRPHSSAPATTQTTKTPLKRKASFIKILDSPAHNVPPIYPYPRQDGTSSPPQQPPDLAAVPTIDSGLQNKIDDNHVYNINLDEIPDAPWRKAGSDITDYFNYGFTEESWKEYASKVKLLGEYNANLEIQKMLELQQQDRGSTRFLESEQELPLLKKTTPDRDKWEVDPESEIDMADAREGFQVPWPYNQQTKGEGIPLGGNIYGMAQPGPIPLCEGRQIMHTISQPTFMATAQAMGIDRPTGVRLTGPAHKSRHANQPFRYLKNLNHKSSKSRHT